MFSVFQLVADLSLLETDPFVQYNPSVLAAAAFCLANYTVNESLWVGLTGYLLWTARGPKYQPEYDFMLTTLFHVSMF